MEIIKIENLTYSYPDSKKQALSNLSLSVNQGEFITVCGKSGCGKTTLLRHLKPILTPHGNRTGRIYFEGRDIDSLTQREQSEKIGFVLQNPDNQIVTDKVWHELAFGLENLSYSSKEIRSRVAEMASFFGIESWFYKNTSSLSGGQKQLLNLAAIMVMQPSLIILDEPTSQLDPIAASEFLEMLYKINRELGVTVILSEHRLEEAFHLSNKVLVMEEGEAIVFGKPQDIGKVLSETESDMVKALPTPMRVHLAVPNENPCPVTIREGKAWLENMPVQKDVEFKDEYRIKENPVITLDDVWFRYEKDLPDVVKGLSLKVNKAEFYAIVGGNGVGKTTSLSLINAINKPYRGKLKVAGKISMLPQNPKVLFTKKTVISDLEEMKADKELLSQVISLCELEELLNQHPYDLSGGEMQRAALAKVLLTSPDILLLDEPTKGLDAHFKEKLAGVLMDLKANGITIIMVSHDIEFCAKYADRCGMFFDGSIVSEETPRAFFGGKSFYTTAASRMARTVIPSAVLEEDIISALCGKTEEKTEKKPADISFKKPEEKLKRNLKKLTVKNLVFGAVFAILFICCQVMFMGKYTGYIDYVVQAVGYLLLGLSLYNLIPQKELGKTPVRAPQNSKKITKRTLFASILILMTIPLTIYIGIFYLGDRRYYFISLMIILQTILPFMLAFESRKPRTAEIVIISVLSALGVAGRCAFSMLPQFKPVLAIIIISGICFGAESGFLVGSITAFASNMFLGQGPWTPWQMFAMGIIGFIAGVLFGKGFLRKTKGSLCIFGGLSTVLVYGGIMNPASVIMYQPNPTWDMILSSYALGLPYDIILAISTVVFLWFTAEPMIEKLDRIKVKYGILK